MEYHSMFPAYHSRKIEKNSQRTTKFVNLAADKNHLFGKVVNNRGAQIPVFYFHGVNYTPLQFTNRGKKE